MRKILALLLLFSFFACSDTQKKSSDPVEPKLLTGISKVYVDYQAALSAAKKENKNIFILFQTQGCRWCKKLKETTLQDQVLTQRLNQEFIVLLLDRDKSHYPLKYHIEGVPTVYMISNKEEIYSERVGYRKDPQDYIKWFNYIKVESGL